ncbi:ABC transporter permease [Shewanella sp. Isolate11]|uniref:ABC transporter permease n=1 Tax=Shewanella sp. Isolate11 TaxID=2908530 RepID=UPI001EFD3871|nr:ABC transporter permease [Shewanella sp. Isolate11]MCG9695500.1 ABC transporter permease [Shewanella sp. Isolate11]
MLIAIQASTPDSIWGLIKRELLALWHDPWQLALVSYIPILGILGLWWLFSAGHPQQLPVAIVDHDNSQMSRMLTRNLQANSVISTLHYQDVASAKAAMESSTVYAMVQLPHQLQHDLLTGHQPSIDIRYNSQYLLVGKLLSSQLQLSLAAGLKDKALLKQLAAGVPKVQAEVNLHLIETQISPLYNANTNYVVFLLPPVLLALVQILAMLVFANSLNRELNCSSLKLCFDAGIYRVIVAKLMVNTLLLLLHGALIFSLLYGVLGLPLAGDPLQLLIAQFVMLMAVWLIVLTIFFMLQESARVISFCTALFAPAFAFMGVTFPTQEMPLIAQWWRQIMPSSHYIETHIGVVSYGQDYLTLAQQLTSYWGFAVLIPLIGLLINRGLKGESSADSQANNMAKEH